MPLIENSSYQKPKWMLSRHFETIVPALFRKFDDDLGFETVRVETPDDDFLDLDWYKNDSNRVVIISHGLEGDSKRPYVQGMVRKFHQSGWNVIAWNFRGCSGVMNHTKKFYHSGATYDLKIIIEFVLKKNLDTISLVGFSLGGNLTLKYLGEIGCSSQITSAVVFSVPLDLAGCSKEIDKPHNILYSRRFLKSLKQKVKYKEEHMPDLCDMDRVEKLNSLYDFDEVVTAKLHGFDSADHYYEESSSQNFVSRIKTPTLVVNAMNDPFFSPECLEPTNFENSECVYLERPKYGGHVGFSPITKGTYWSEDRAFEFVSKYLIPKK